jgi:hypothetical protein
MNRIQKEWLALYQSAKIYYKYRKAPLEFYNHWEFRKKPDTTFQKWKDNYLKHIILLKNKYLGEDCFVIGNGPSLNKMDLLPLNDYYTFGLNKIYLIFRKIQLNLSFLVSVNPLVIQQSVEEFNRLKIPKFLSYYGSKNINGLDENTIKIFTKAGLESTGNLETPLNEGYTVTNVALQVAFYLGFNQVFLIGVDHSYRQSGNPNEEQIMNSDDINHFDPNYFKGQKWHLADIDGSEMAYLNTKFLFERNNRKIFDSTVEGKLQVFEKLPFSKALLMAKKKSV